MFKSKKDKNRFKMIPDKKKSHKWIIAPVAFVLLLALVVYTLYDNGRIVVDYVTVKHSQVPDSFDGYKILQISDLHGKKFGEENNNLVEVIDSIDYDMILLTGDYMDEPNGDNYWDIIDLLEDIKNKDVPKLYILGESDYMPENTDKLSDDWNMCINPRDKTNLMKSFEELGVLDEILLAISELGFEYPMPVQEAVIPYLLGNGNDVVALAQTGTGKTAAFGILITRTSVRLYVWFDYQTLGISILHS